MSSPYGRIKGARAAIILSRHQTDALLAQAAPVSTQLYDILPVTPNVEILGVYVSVVWTVQPTPLEVVITIDGVTYTAAVANPVSAAPYPVFQNWILTTGTSIVLTTAAVYTQHKLLAWSGRSVRVQARTTGGTVQNLYGKVIWAQW